MRPTADTQNSEAAQPPISSVALAVYTTERKLPRTLMIYDTSSDQFKKFLTSGGKAGGAGGVVSAGASNSKAANAGGAKPGGASSTGV